MTLNLTPLVYTGATSNTVFDMANLVNQLVGVLANQTVTANTVAGGAMSSGNGFVSGIFGANTITATTLRGGNVGTTTALALSANLTATGFKVTFGNVVANDTTLSVGANVIINTTVYWTGNATVNATLSLTSLNLGNTTANAIVNTSVLYIGAAAANSFVNSTAVVSPNGIFGVISVVNSSGFFYNGTPVTGGATVTPGGANTQVQFSNSGAFGGDPGLTYNYLTDTLASNTHNANTFNGNTVNANTVNSNTIIASVNVSTNTVSSNVVNANTVNANTIVANTFNSVKQTLSFNAGTTTWNTALGAVAALTLTANTTLAAPTGIGVSSYILLVYQDASGNRKITWNSTYKWPGATAPVLSTAVNALDVFSFVCDGVYMYGSYLNGVG